MSTPGTAGISAAPLSVGGVVGGTDVAIKPADGVATTSAASGDALSSTADPLSASPVEMASEVWIDLPGTDKRFLTPLMQVGGLSSVLVSP